MTHRVTIQKYTGFEQERFIHRGLIRLLAWAARQEETWKLLGVKAREIARLEFDDYATGEYIFLLALSKNRVVGLLVLSHEFTESLMLGHRVWEIRRMIVAPDAPQATYGELVKYALEYMESEQGLLRARVAAWDGTSINALSANGFNVVTGEAVCVFKGKARWDVRHPDLSFVYMSPEHVDDASKLVLPCSTMSWRGVGHSESSRMEALIGSLLCRSIKNDNAGVIVAHHGEKLVGYVRFDLPKGKSKGLMAKIDPPVVLPEYLHHGAFELLIRRSLVVASQNGLDAASVHVPVNEYSASGQLKSLRKLGFQVVRSDLLMRRWSMLGKLGSDKHEDLNSLQLGKKIDQRLGVQPPRQRPEKKGPPLFVPSPPGGISSSLPSSRRGEYSS